MSELLYTLLPAITLERAREDLRYLAADLRRGIAVVAHDPKIFVVAALDGGVERTRAGVIGTIAWGVTSRSKDNRWLPTPQSMVERLHSCYPNLLAVLPYQIPLPGNHTDYISRTLVDVIKHWERQGYSREAIADMLDGLITDELITAAQNYYDNKWS